MPPAAQVRDALERVLSSEVFARSERARDLLRYLVNQDLAGNADRLKGFSIAVDVFGRDDRFDPATDTVVRVQAGRLRDLLDQYYAQEGAPGGVRISIPRGSYVPTYDADPSGPPLEEPAQPAASGEIANAPVQTAAEAAAETAPVAAAARPPLSRRLIAAGAALVLLAAFATITALVWPLQSGGDDVAAAAALDDADDMTAATPRGMLPTLYLDVRVNDAEGERVAGLFRRGLSGFDTVTFIARPPEPEEQPARRRDDHVLLIESADDDALHIEIQNLATGKVILARGLAVAGRSTVELEDEIAALLTSVTPVSGAIYASIADDQAETLLVRCLLLSDRFYRNQNAQAHRAAYDCMLELADAGTTSPLVYSELAGLQIQAMSARYTYPPDRSDAQALEFARQGIQYGPNSPYAHRAMGYVLSRTANAEEAMRWTRKAYELNTFDLGMAASYGYGLVMDGLYAEGTPILQRAVTAISAHPTWWDYGLALGHLMLDEQRAAANAAAALAASGRSHYIAVRLVIAQERGDVDEVGRLADQLRQDRPEFVADPRAAFVRASYPQDMTDRLLQTLHAAGLADAS